MASDTAEPADHLRQQHVFQRCELRQQVVRLVDEADLVAADAGALVVGQDRGRAAVDIDVAVVGMLEQAGDVQKRRLAGTGWRYQRHRLPAPERKLDAVEHVQRLVALPVVALDVVQEQDRNFLVLLRLRPCSCCTISTWAAVYVSLIAQRLHRIEARRAP